MRINFGKLARSPTAWGMTPVARKRLVHTQMARSHPPRGVGPLAIWVPDRGEITLRLRSRDGLGLSVGMHSSAAVPSASCVLGYPCAMGDIQDNIENKAEELKGSSSDQHLGDAMDDADLEPAGNVTGDGELEAGGARQRADGDERDEAERYSLPPDEGDA
jgi:uncharacterized protein YjbJ (UPF0337 family)